MSANANVNPHAARRGGGAAAWRGRPREWRCAKKARAAEAVPDLREGRLDTIFYDRPALLDAVAESGGAPSVTPLETRERYGVAVRKGRPDLLAAVNAAIRDRKEGGAK